MWTKIALLTLLCAAICADNSKYNGYKVYEVYPHNIHNANFLHELSKDENNYDFWTLTRIPHHSAMVMVSPTAQQQFEADILSRDMTFNVTVKNVFDHLEHETKQREILRSQTRGVGFTTFHKFDEINAYLDELAVKYPTLVKVTLEGKSNENRDIKTITISNGKQTAGKKIIFVDAGIHAREWIAPAAALYFINQLVEENTKNADLLNNFDWIILPVVNPDGYEYTHSKERYWRKTRSVNSGSSSCFGTDGNRNFDFHWGEVGASASVCSDTYRGATPFSEPETKVVRDIILRNKGKIVLYLTLHTYGNYLLYPWGWTSALPATWKDLDEVAQAGASAIYKKTGTKYSVGSSTNVLYAAAGGSDDWAFAVGEADISLTMELNGGRYGFDPPASYIKEYVEETWTGVQAIVEKAEQKYIK